MTKADTGGGSGERLMGYTVWAPDNGTHMWADPKTRGTPPPGVLCDACGQRIDYHAINPNYKPPRSYYDLCRAYDGDLFVSPRLREWLEAQSLEGLRFVELPKSERYFVLQTTNILTYIPAPTTKREEFCAVCRQHKSVWGNQPETARYENVPDPIQRGIYFSDIKVGYGPQMGPLLIVGIDTWQNMLAQNFKGLNGGKPIIN